MIAAFMHALSTVGLAPKHVAASVYVQKAAT